MNQDRVRIAGITGAFLLCIATTLAIGIGEAGCTAAQGKTAIVVGDAVCEGGMVLIHVEVPGIPDLCATIAEFVTAQANLAAAAAAKVGASSAAPGPSAAEIRAEILRMRAAAAPAAASGSR